MHQIEIREREEEREREGEAHVVVLMALSFHHLGLYFVFFSSAALDRPLNAGCGPV